MRDAGVNSDVPFGQLGLLGQSVSRKPRRPSESNHLSRRSLRRRVQVRRGSRERSRTLSASRSRRGLLDRLLATSIRSTAAAIGSAQQPEHWIFDGTGMKKGDRIPGLIGWEYHGDPPQDIAGPGNRRRRNGAAGRRESAAVDGHDLSRPQGQLRLQRIDDLLVPGLGKPAGPHLPWSHWSRPHGPDPRVQQITKNLLERACRK